MKAVVKYVLKLILGILLAWIIASAIILLTDQKIHHQSRMGIIFIK